MPGRVRGGVVRRTGDRVGDALEMRTRRVGVDGFVASLRSIFFFWQLSLLRSCRLPASSFFLPKGWPLGSVFLGSRGAYLW